MKPWRDGGDYALVIGQVQGDASLALFGILVRDQEPREADLKVRGGKLASSLTAPTRCCLIALYLPWPIAQLPEAIGQGGAA